MSRSVSRNKARDVNRLLVAAAGAKHHRLWKLGLLLLIGLTLGAIERSAQARPGPGYGDLIDKYCIAQARLRVGAHQGHCAACHHQGTFDIAPEHRIEPNWNEFERGRQTGVFDFFCPPAQASAASPMPQPPVGRAVGSPPVPSSPMGMPPAAAQPRASQAQAPQPPSSGPAQSQVEAAPAAPTAPFELGGRLSSLHDAVGIQPGQEPAWLEFLDAMAAATRREPVAVTTAIPAARLKIRERELSEQIVALRGLDLALSRLSAQLNETQRRTLSEGLTPLLDAIR